MSKKMKVLIATLVAVLLLMVGATTVVMAQEEEETVPEPEVVTEEGAKGFLARVADILGVTEEELQAVFNEARQQMQDEAIIRFLGEAVEEGLIIQEEADEILAWWQQRPEALGLGLFRHIFRFRASQGIQQGLHLEEGCQLGLPRMRLSKMQPSGIRPAMIRLSRQAGYSTGSYR